MLVRRDPPLLAGVNLDDGVQGRAGVGKDGVAAPRSRPQAPASDAGSPGRPSRASSSASVRAMSWQRSTRTPARSSAG
jgi:hypothetical protein